MDGFLPNGKVGVTYNASILSEREREYFKANGITNNWSLEYPFSPGESVGSAEWYGKLPSGLSISPDGTISGTPTVAGAFTFVVMTIRDGRKVHGGRVITIEE